MKKLATVFFLSTGFIAIRAQNNYSPGVVGFCTLNVQSNQTVLIANPFLTASNVLSQLLPGAPLYSTFRKSALGVPLSTFGPSGWSPDLTLNPGEAGFFMPSATLQIAFPGTTNDQVGLYTNNSPTTFRFNGTWSPSEPFPGLGQGFTLVNAMPDATSVVPGTLRNMQSGVSPDMPDVTGEAGGTAPAAPVAISPIGSGQSATPTYTFNMVSNATSYTVYIWDYANQTSDIHSSLTPEQVDPFGNGVGQFLQPTNLAVGWYTWIVNAANELGVSPWSDYMTFTVGTVPAAPTALSPGGSAEISGTRPIYSFRSITNAESYTIYLWDYQTLLSTYLGPLTPAQIDPQNTGTCYYTNPTSLELGGYTWYVYASNGDGDGPWSAFMTFVVGAVPDAPVGISPVGDGQGPTPTYVFNTVANAASYTLFVWDYATQSAMIYSSLTPEQVDPAHTGQGQFTQPTHLAVGTYTWVVDATDAVGTGPWSAYMTFTVPDSDGDGIPDWWLIQHFGHPTGQASDLSRAGDDPDNDGLSNFQEYILGTNPLQAAAQDDGTINLQVYTAFK